MISLESSRHHINFSDKKQNVVLICNLPPLHNLFWDFLELLQNFQVYMHSSIPVQFGESTGPGADKNAAP